MKPVIYLSLFSLLMVISFHSYAQETILLKGKIRADSLNGASIHIFNPNKNSGTISSPTGEFKITVSIHDTIYFTSIQFKEEKKVINRQIMEEGYFIVNLTERINELDEVFVSNLSLTGNLKVDVSKIRVYDQAFFGFPVTKHLTMEERRLKSAKTGSVNYLFNYLSGKTTYLEQLKTIEEQKGIAQKGMAAVATSYFINSLRIPENQILDFIYYCMENPNFHLLLLPQRGLDLIEYYQMKAPQYLIHKKEN